MRQIDPTRASTRFYFRSIENSTVTVSGRGYEDNEANLYVEQEGEEGRNA